MTLPRPCRRAAAPAFLAVLLGAVLPPGGAFAASPAKLVLGHQRLELPGVPVQILAVDLNRDGKRDLAVVVASTSWGEVGFEEPMQVDEGGTFVDVLTVVPTVLDRRELLVFPGSPAGFTAPALRLELPSTVHAMAAGPAVAPLVVWTDDGVAEVVLAEPAAQEALALVPRIVARSIFAGSSSYLAKSGLIADLDGDREPDLFVPVAEGLAVHLATAMGLTSVAASLVRPPETDPADRTPVDEVAVVASGDEDEARGRPREAETVRDFLLPEVIDLNGDALPDLLYRDPERGREGLRLRLNLGEGRFGPAFDPMPGWSAEAVPGAVAAAKGDDSEAEPPRREVVWLGDLDGDREADVVTSLEVPSGKDSMRAELAEAKRPHARIRVHALGKDGRWNPVPKAEFTVEGYVFDAGEDGDDGHGDDEGVGFSFPSGVRDLDGDGRLDLVALSLDFSLFEAMRVLATKSFKLGLDFGIYRQGEGLSFLPVTGLDLSGELRLRLDSLSLGQLSSFAGDFDGDGRADFVQLGRGRKVTIHRGQPGARYAPEPDLAILLEREPLDVALVSVADLDGDGRSDLCVTQPVGGKAIGARAALDLYLSSPVAAGSSR